MRLYIFFFMGVFGVKEHTYDVILMIQGQGYLLRSLKGKKMLKKCFSGIRLSMGHLYLYLS